MRSRDGGHSQERNDGCLPSFPELFFCLLQNNPLESVTHDKNYLFFILNLKIESGIESFIIFVKVSALSLVVWTNFSLVKL